MSSLSQLSRLVRVDLREAWPHEAANFTPWLAEEENLRLLGDTLGLELQLEAIEKPVESFSADILAKDTISGNMVVIENQLEQTDHNHLGQILTYAAGLNARTVIWIAREFRDPHRAAIDYLNEISSPDHNFFGVQLELYRIENSPYAPRFNIVAKPNDLVQAPDRAVQIEPGTDRGQAGLGRLLGQVLRASRRAETRPRQPRRSQGGLVPRRAAKKRRSERRGLAPSFVSLPRPDLAARHVGEGDVRSSSRA